jgi:hypothetical protein
MGKIIPMQGTVITEAPLAEFFFQHRWSKVNGGCIMHATSVEGSPWRHIDQRGLVSRLVTSALVWVFILPLYALPSCSKFSASIPLFPTHPSMFILDDFIWYYVTWNIMYRPLYIVFRFHWLAFSICMTGAGGMPWQNCQGYLLLLLILLIVALIVAAQLLWQYFLPSRLVPT